LTAQCKLALYRATRAPEAPVGEILREYGLHLDDLREIEQTVESATLAALKVHGRHGRWPSDVSPERVLQFEQELSEKTRTLAELSVAFTVLENKEREDSQRVSPAGRSTPSPATKQRRLSASSARRSTPIKVAASWR
jgi:hypothetical protein